MSASVICGSPPPLKLFCTDIRVKQKTLFIRKRPSRAKQTNLYLEQKLGVRIHQSWLSLRITFLNSIAMKSGRIGIGRRTRSHWGFNKKSGRNP